MSEAVEWVNSLVTPYGIIDFGQHWLRRWLAHWGKFFLENYLYEIYHKITRRAMSEAVEWVNSLVTPYGIIDFGQHWLRRWLAHWGLKTSYGNIDFGQHWLK